MNRITWIETRDGWQSGRYQIELAAPRLWVLSLRPKKDTGAGVAASRVLRTSGSLQELKHATAEFDRRLARRRRVRISLATTLSLFAMSVAMELVGSALVIPAVIAAIAMALRTLAIWVEGTTGGAWSVLSQHYQ